MGSEETARVLAVEEKAGGCEWKGGAEDLDGNFLGEGEGEEAIWTQRVWTLIAYGLFTLTVISAVLNLFASDYSVGALISGSVRNKPVPYVTFEQELHPVEDHPPQLDGLGLHHHAGTHGHLEWKDGMEAHIPLSSTSFSIVEFPATEVMKNVPPGFLMHETVGQTVVHDGKAYLTSQIASDENGVVPKPNSVGRLMHPRPFLMKYRGLRTCNERVVSFHTTFVFSIKNLLRDREATGDGFAFVMVPESNVLGGGGGFLGVMNSTGADNTFAVEFDIWQNPALRDMSNNHVGINVNSMVSVLASDAGYWNEDDIGHRQPRFNHVDLTSGKIQAWIDYDGPSQELTVSISPELGSKPQKPLLSMRLDLTKVFQNEMYAGFSAATGEFSAKHVIHSWGFEKHMPSSETGFRTLRLPHHHHQHHFFPESGLPLAGKPMGMRCREAIQQFGASAYSSAQEVAARAYSSTQDLFMSLSSLMTKVMNFRNWPEILIGFVLGQIIIRVVISLYHTCLGCRFGRVECYESTRELQDLDAVDKQGQFIFVLCERRDPRPCNVV